jgi:hypothetical protein
MATSNLFDKIPGEYSNFEVSLHDGYSARVNGQIVEMTATGPYNEVMARSYAQKLGALLANAKKHGAFGVLIEFRESMLLSQDAIKVFADFMVKAKASGLRAVGTAYVASSNVEGAFLMASVFRKQVYEPAGVAFDVFPTIEPAQQWLNWRLAAEKVTH